MLGLTLNPGAISRKDNVACKMIENTDTETLTRFVRNTVSDKVDLVATDEHSGYRYLKWAMPHQVIKHSENEYVRGEVHTNASNRSGRCSSAGSSGRITT